MTSLHISSRLSESADVRRRSKIGAEDIVTQGQAVSIRSSTGAQAPGEPVDLTLLEETLTYIRPAIQADGGDIILLGVEEGTVTLQMVGACGGCPLSMMTLKAGLERILTDRVPGVTEVVAL